MSDAAISHDHRGLRLLAKALIPLALLVILLGGKTKSLEAGLTIAEGFILDWKPEWLTTANISAEYTHRISAGFFGVMVLLFTLWAFIVERRRTVKLLAVATLVGVLVQAILGVIAVNNLAPARFSIPHAVLAQAVFVLTCCLACLTSRTWTSDLKPVQESHATSLRRLAVWLMIAILIQLLLGAALRHDDKGAALREGRGYIFMWHLVAHIAGAFFVLYRVLVLAVRVFHDHRQFRALLTPTRWITYLLALQLILGTAAAILKAAYSMDYDSANAPPAIRVFFATAHQVVGAVIFGLSGVVAAYSWRLVEPSPAATRSVPKSGTESGTAPLEAST
ncbi:MAG TPA: COX15/CtaA family protein [Planctomycetota bacterium]|nr:COX15/CtaA family protein [Planctomycetota bacterium]